MATDQTGGGIYHFALDALPNSIYILDHDLTILWANQGALGGQSQRISQPALPEGATAPSCIVKSPVVVLLPSAR
jgi:hypothetical protein